MKNPTGHFYAVFCRVHDDSECGAAMQTLAQANQVAKKWAEKNPRNEYYVMETLHKFHNVQRVEIVCTKTRSS